MGTKSLYRGEDYDLKLLSELVDSLEHILESRGVPRRATPDAVWEDFAKQPSDERATTIKNLTEYLDILMYAEAQVKEDKDERQLLWHVIKYLGLVPPDDLFKHILDNDFIEIYNSSGIQVYRNLEFCKIVSYSIAELSVYRWDQLYSRDQGITNLIITEGMQKGFSGTRQLFKLQIPQHEVWEVFRGGNRRYSADFGYLCPLIDRNSKGVSHILSTCQIGPVGSNKKFGKQSA